MKKVIALVAVCGFAWAFVACGQKTETAVEEVPEMVEEAVEPVQEAVDSVASEVEEVVDSVAAE